MNEMVSDAVDLPTAAPPPADTQHDVADDTPEAGSVEQLKAAVERSLKELHPADLDSPGGPKAAVPPDAARAPGSVPADRAEQREEQPPPITRPDDMPRAWGNDRIQLWQSLPEDVRAQARELAASQEAYFTNSAMSLPKSAMRGQRVIRTPRLWRHKFGRNTTNASLSKAHSTLPGG